MRRQSRGERGFTLIEMLVVMVVVGILAMVAVPGYQSAMQKSRRADARVALSDTSQRLERCYTQYGNYASANCVIVSPFNSPQGYYSVSVVRAANTYTVAAQPQGAQLQDTACGKLEVMSTGQHTAYGTDPTRCW